jgi:2-polyprenyl-3-methyl-5-hydroxy-6-metoxy-1,4-benzoquinol methylase
MSFACTNCSSQSSIAKSTSMFETDDFAKKWDQDRIRTQSSLDIANRFLNVLRPYLDATRTKMLDFGCGSGEITCHFSPYVASVVGVDTSAQMLSLFQRMLDDQRLQSPDKYSNVSFRRVNLLEMDESQLQKEKYDVILASRILIFLDDFPSVLKLLCQLLNKDGVLVGAELEKYEKSGEFFSEETKKDVRYMGLSKDELKQSLLDAGFTRIEIQVFPNEKQNRKTKKMETFPFLLYIAYK